MLLAMIMILSCVPMEGLAAIVPVNGPTTSSDGISLFSIVQQPVATYTYVFKNGENEVTQIVKNGEYLLDPGTPTGTGKFLGWYDGDTQVTFDTPITVTETKTITCTAKFDNILHVYFVHNNIIVATKEGQADADGNLTVTVDDVTVNVGAEEKFNGWSDGTKIVDASFTTDADVTLTADVSTGHWITFDSQGGSYVEPKFVPNGENGTEPAAPTRPGYTFDHWSKEDGSEYKWSDTVTDSLTLDAVWTAKTDTQYTVIHWLENADDTNYSYKESETKTGTTGESTHAVAKSYQGFTVVPEGAEDTEHALVQQTIAGDGSTIVNVYYKRIEYTITFHLDDYYYACGKAEHTHNFFCGNGRWCSKEEHTHSSACGKTKELTITAKYGANISDQWPTVDGSSSWYVGKSQSNTWQNSIDTMPLNGTDFYGPKDSYSFQTAYYYVEVLPGETGDVHNSVTYKLHHSDTSSGTGSVTVEDKYPITGFTYKEGTANGQSYGNATFYYTRNSYNIVYISGGKAEDETKSYKYEQSIADAGNYEPKAKPEGQSDYTFAGWYADPECTKEYVFADAKMPAENITVYAKWNPPVRTLTVQLMVPGGVGGQTENIVRNIPVGEDRADALNDLQDLIMDALGEGYEWHGWKKEDDTPFNVHTKITVDTTIYASFSKAGQFSVVYDKNNKDVTGTAPTDGNSYADGAYATVLPGTGMTAPVGMVFLGWNTQTDGKGTTYQPGSSFLISAADADKENNIYLYAQWGNTPATVSLTYKANNGTNDSETYNYLNNQTVTTITNPFTAPTGYKFKGWGESNDTNPENVIGANTEILLDTEDNGGANVLYAIWEPDESQTHSITYKVEYYQDGTLKETSGPDTDSEWIGTELEVKFTKSGVAPTGKYGSAYRLESVKVDGSEVAESWSVSLDEYETSDYTADNPYVIKVYYAKNQFQLTIHYQYAGGAEAADDHTENVTVGQGYSVSSPTITGYTPDISTVSGTMPANNVEVTVTYTANSHAVKYEYTGAVQPTNAPTVPPEANHNYGTEVTVAATPSLDGYTFEGWTTKDATIAGGKFSMPDDDVTLQGEWHANTDTPYTVEWYLEDLNGNYPTTATASEERTGTTDTDASVTEDDKKGIPGTSIDNNGITLDMNAANVFSGTIVGSRTLVLKLYFKRNTYTVTYTKGDHGDFTDDVHSNVKYGASTPAFAGTKGTDGNPKGADGYTFNRWDNAIAQTVTADATYTAQWTANGNTPYKVEHYQQNEDDDGFTLHETENLTGKTDTTATATAKNYTGFTFDNTVEGTVTSGTIAGDGSLVLKLYYTRNSYDVTYTYTGTVPSGATNLPTKASYKYGATVEVAAAATASGYKFSGWSTTDATVGADGTFTMPAKHVEIKGSFKRDFENGGDDGQFKFDVGNYEGTYDAGKHTVTISGLIEGEDFVSFSTDGGTTWTDPVAWDGTIPADLMQSEVKWNTTPNAGSPKYYYMNGGTAEAVAYPTVYVMATNGEATSTKSGTIKINPVSLNINIKGAEFDYDGNAHGLSDAEGYVASEYYELSGAALVAGQTLSISEPLAKYSSGTGQATEKVTNVGTYFGMLAGTISITDGSNSTLLNYLISSSVQPLVIKGNGIVPEKTLVTVGTVELGSLLTYNITVKNVSTTAVTNVQVEDPTAEIIVPQGVTGVTLNTDKHTATIDSIPAGGEVVLNAQHAVTEQDLIGCAGKDADGKDKLYKNTANIKLDDKTISVSDNGIDLPEPESKLTVTKKSTNKGTGENGAFKLGETIEYTITVTNDGNLTISNVVVTDQKTGATFDANDAYTVGTDADGHSIATLKAALAPKASVTLTAKYIVTEADILAGSVENSATAAGKDPSGNDPEVTPGTTTDKTETKKTELTVTKTDSKDEGYQYKLGEKITYEITVKNTGNQTITDIVVTDDLAGATIIAGMGYTVEENKAVVGTLAPNASVTVNAEYTVTEADILAGSVINSATAKGSSEDPDKPEPDGTGETEDDTEEPNAHFSLEKKLTNLPNKGYFTVGETAEFNVVVTNDGNVTLNNVNVFETLTGAAFTAVAENESNAEVTLNETVAVIASLAPGKSVTLKAEYTVKAEDLGNKDLKNVVTGKGEGPKTDPEKPIDPDDPETEENIPVDDAVIVKITKKWDDGENKYESRPESVSFTLYQSVDKENSAIGKLVVSEETDWTAESGKLPAHTEDGAEITYTLTENEVTGYDWNYTVQLPPSADTNEQLPPQDDQSREAKVVEQKYTVTNTLEKYKLTIRYWKNAVGGEKVTGDYSAEYAYNAPYSVQSPDLYGWDADMSRVEGRMPNDDLVVDVVYRQLIYKLTIYYIFEDGTTAHKEYEAKLTAGEKFAVESPEIEGYKPNLWMISGEMPARDLNYTVIYMAQNTPVDLSAATTPLGIGNVVPNAGDCFD